MKCLCNIRCKLWKDIDMFGKEPDLYYKGNTKKTSWIGRILSILFFTIYFAFFAYKLIRMITKIDVTFYDTFTYSPEPPAVKITKENFFGGFALENPITYDPFIDESIYIPKAYFKRAERKGDDFEWQIIEIKLERCKLESFGTKYQEIFKTKALNDLYCFKEMNYTLEGHFSYDLYSFIYIQLFPCVNITEKQTCKPLEEIDYYLRNTFITVHMQDIELTPKSYDSPVRPRNADIYTTVGKQLFREIHTFFQVVNIETDMDFIGFDEFENIKSEVFLKYDEMIVMSNIIETDIYQTGESFCDFTIKLSENIRTERRTYTKLITILGDVGGLMEVIFTLFRVISSFSVDILYEISLVNNLFNFNLIKKLVLMKFNNKKKDKNNISKKNIHKRRGSTIDLQTISSRKSTITDEDEKASKFVINVKMSRRNSVNSEKKVRLNKQHIKKSKFHKVITLTNTPPDYFSTNNENINITRFENKNLNRENTLKSNDESQQDNNIIIKKINMKRFCIYCCFCFSRRRNIIQNILLDEGMSIISERLDIFNLFEKMYRDEKNKDKIFELEENKMSDKCKVKLEYICRKNYGI